MMRNSHMGRPWLNVPLADYEGIRLDALSPEVYCCEAVIRIWIECCFHLSGANTGVPLFFTKNTSNLAGFLLLALRPTT